MIVRILKGPLRKGRAEAGWLLLPQLPPVWKTDWVRLCRTYPKTAPAHKPQAKPWKGHHIVIAGITSDINLDT